jgi:hydroxymethylglutaryl-CoA reductase (NADPH)
VAEICIPADICQNVLKTSPQAMVDLNSKKNLVGSIAAGSLASANAHYANMLLAIYLATGQDGANIVEGSQGITCASLDTAGDSLVFSVTLPNLIVGVVGNGKHIPFVKKNLNIMGCLYQEGDEPGAKSRRLAEIIAAAVLCGELSLMAAQTNPGELTKSHIRIERNAKP